jgi:hypothetical protein
MHQIRVHLQYLGHPVINDPLYNHPVFGPAKGRGGDMGGRSDEQLVEQLMELHSAEHWLGEEGADVPEQEVKGKLENNCYECTVRYRDPQPDDLVMFLHALRCVAVPAPHLYHRHPRYSGPGWSHQTPLPPWAEPGWAAGGTV